MYNVLIGIQNFKKLLKLLQIQVNNIELYVTQQRFMDNNLGQASGFQTNDNKAFDDTMSKNDMEQQAQNAGIQPINLFPL